MQINGTTLTPRQAHLVRDALRREQARTLDAMRMLDMHAVDPKACEHVSGALTLALNEIITLLFLIHDENEQEGAEK